MSISHSLSSWTQCHGRGCSAANRMCLSVQVVEALRPHGLTLQNFASIREQAIGGFIQVGAHGTGARIPPRG